MENIISRQEGSTPAEASLSDTELWSRIIHYGEEARMWRQKFLGLLPEVNRRELWKAHGFESVFVFAFKVGGVSKEQVERVLGVEERLRDRPILHEMLVRGEVSVNKIARVVSVATRENEEALANQVKLLPRQALETLVRDMRSYGKIIEPQGESENMSNQFSFVHVHTLGKFTLTPEATQKLQELYDKGIDVSEFIVTAVARRAQEIQQEKERIAAEMEKSQQETQAHKSKLPTRYIPRKIKSIIRQEYGTKCAIANCQKPSREIHHTARYAMIRNHNPNFLAPLCVQHHQIAHAIDVRCQEKRAGSHGT